MVYFLLVIYKRYNYRIVGGGLPTLITGALLLWGRGYNASKPYFFKYDTLQIMRIIPNSFQTGRFLSYSFSTNSKNIGFNFSPTRNMSEAIFWNSSAIALSNIKQFSVFADFQRFFQASFSIPCLNRFGVGFGLIVMRHKEDRSVLIETNEVVSVPQKSLELGVFWASSFKLNENVSFGITLKQLDQKIEEPSLVIRGNKYSDKDSTFISSKYFFSSEEISNFISEVDISSTFNLTSSFKLGLVLMNILGNKVRFKDKYDNVRSYGIGFTYFKSRLNLGSNIKVSRNKSTLAIGCNYVPFDNTRFNFGITNENQSYVIGLKLYFISYNFHKNKIFGSSHNLGLNIVF